MNRLPWHCCLSLSLVCIGSATLQTPAYVPLFNPPQELKKENSNALLKKHQGKLQLTSSTSYGGSWPVTNLVDGNLRSSWFSAAEDAAALGGTPWVEIQLPADETVRRVNIIGNRDPSYPTGYSVLEGKMEFLDKDRNKLWSAEMKGAGTTYDFEFRPRNAIKDVRYIRFTSTKDQGAQNGSRDIALSEILAE